MLDEIKQTKLKKLENLRKAGMEVLILKKQSVQWQIRKRLRNSTFFREKKYALLGRVKSLRPMGGSAFSHIEDESGKIQIFLNKWKLGDEK